MSFKKLEQEDFLVSVQPVSQTVWSGYKTTLKSFQTSSNQVQSPSGRYYLSVYSDIDQMSNTVEGEEVQFDIAYAHRDGEGSVPYNNEYKNRTPTSAIYGQYRTLLLEDENSEFNFGGKTSKHFFAININRSRYKEKLLPGSFNLTLSSSEGSINITDNSGMVSVPQYYGTQRVYQLVSGSNGVAAGYTTGTNDPNKGFTVSGSYGWFLPDIGAILLNADVLSLSYANGGVGATYATGYAPTFSNNEVLYKLLTKDPSNDIKGFTLNSEETISSDYIFIRVRNSEFNYSENPSFMKGSNGEVIHDVFINNPQVYPTTIGLYNDSNDLIAVAKLSRPLLKDFTKELLLRVKIDF